MNSLPKYDSNAIVSTLTDENLTRIAHFCAYQARLRLKQDMDSYRQYRDDAVQEAHLSLIASWEQPVYKAIQRAIYDVMDYICTYISEVPRWMTSGAERKEYKAYLPVARYSIEYQSEKQMYSQSDTLSYQSSPNLRLQHITSTHSPEDWLIQFEEQAERQMKMETTRRIIFALLLNNPKRKTATALAMSDLMYHQLEGESLRAMRENMRYSRSRIHHLITQVRQEIQIILDEEGIPSLDKCWWCEEAQVCRGCTSCDQPICLHCCPRKSVYCPGCSDSGTRRFFNKYLSA